MALVLPLQAEAAHDHTTRHDLSYQIAVTAAL